MVCERPAADLRTVEFEVMEPECFGGDQAVRAGRRAVEALGEEIQNGLRPRWGVVAARAAGEPVRTLFLRAGAQVSTGQSVEAAGREAELRGGLGGRQFTLPERVEHMADEGRCVTMDELWMLFKDAQDSRRSWPHHSSSRRASLRSPSSKTSGAAKEIPVLLTTNLVLFCSPRDTILFADSRRHSTNYCSCSR